MRLFKFLKQCVTTVLTVVTIGFLVLGVSACSLKTKTLSDGTTQKVAVFNTNVLNLNAQAAVTGFASIEAIPEVNDYLNKNPKVASELSDTLAKIRTISTAIKNNSGGSVTVAVGSNWANSISQEISAAITIAQPIVAQVAPKYVRYVSLVQALVPLLDSLAETFGEPLANPNTFGTPAQNPDMLRKNINMGARAYVAAAH